MSEYEELLGFLKIAAESGWGVAILTDNENRTLLREQINQCKRDTEYHSLRVLTPRYPEDELWLVPRNENLLKLRSISIEMTLHSSRTGTDTDGPPISGNSWQDE